MKAIFLALVIVTALTAIPAAASDQSANYYLPSCRAFANEQFAKDPFRQGECVGIIEGLAVVASDMASVSVFAGIGSCPPNDITVAQLTTVVVRWLDQHPERWNEDFMPLVLLALHDAWPCN